MGKIYVAKKTTKIDWKLSNETNKIGNCITKKATSKFRGRM
jgi:GLPGLI family protein